MYKTIGKYVKMIHKKILVICPNPVGYAPGQRLKYEQYFEFWEKNGYDVTVKPFISETFQKVVYKNGHYLTKVFETIKGYGRRLRDISEIKKYDIVYIFLWVTPFGFSLFERIYCAAARKVIYDIDDLVYTTNQSTPWYLKLLKTQHKPIYLMKKADHVITCTPYLDKFVRQFNENTTDISSTVETSRYIPVNRFTNDLPLTIGWSGSHSTIRHFMTIKNVLRHIQQKYPDIKISVMGGSNVIVDGLKIDSTEWSEEKEISTLQTFDIGIYPLPDEQWVYGKSGLKAIQYMAIGIPAIATAIGTNFRVIEEGVTGFLVDSEEAWIEKLSLLIENPALRRSLGVAARLKVEKEFSVEANKRKYLEAFDQVLNIHAS